MILTKMTMETVRLDTQPIDAALFTVPADYSLQPARR
jgi:hypothetical protein